MQNSPQVEDRRDTFTALAAALLIISSLVLYASLNDPAASPAQGQSFGPAVHDPAVRASLDGFDDAMIRPRPELSALAYDGEMRVQNCVGYLNAISRLGRIAELLKAPAAGHYADCLALRALHFSRAPAAFLGPRENLGRIMVERLDPVAASSLLPSWIKPARRLSGAGADEIAAQGRTMTLRGAGETLTFDVVASADIGGRGMEDLVVRITGSGAVRYAILEADASGALRPVDEQSLLIRLGNGPAHAAGAGD